MSLPAAFAAKTVQSTCTVWVGSINTKGYGLVLVDGTARLAHRIAYEAEHGPIPEGLTVDHLCRVRNCVRVDHLELVTVGENLRRGRAASGLAVGDSCINGHALTSEADIYRRASGATECRQCRGAVKNQRGGRPTVRNRADDAKAVHAHGGDLPAAPGKRPRPARYLKGAS